MSTASDRETLEKAKAMGLKLSADGKTWVQNDEMVVQLPTKSKVNQAQDIGFSIFRGFAIVSIITLLGVIFLLSLVMEFFRNVAG